MVDSSGGNDRKKPSRPSRAQDWMADHRLVVRVVLIVIDVVLLLMAIANVAGWPGVPGTIYPLVVVWGSVTVLAGWMVPHNVDRWRQIEESRSQPP